MIIGFILLCIGFYLMWSGLKPQLSILSARPSQAQLNQLAEDLQTKSSKVSPTLFIGLVCAVAGLMLLANWLSHKDDANLKRCLTACQEQGFSKAKWPGFCRCIEGLRHLDIDLPAP